VNSNPINKIDPRGLCEADCDPGWQDPDDVENPFSEILCKIDCWILYYPYSLLQFEDCLRRCSPNYPELPEPKDLPLDKDYNCAGLAFRTFDYEMDTREEVRHFLEQHGRALNSCSDECKPYEEKCWFWEIDLYVYDAYTDELKGHYPDEFHVVCGEAGRDGSDPEECISKDGPRPIEGGSDNPENRPCGMWKPKDQNFEVQSGINYEFFRWDFNLTCYCGDYIDCTY